MFIILHIMLLIFKFQNYRIQFRVICISLFFYFFKLIIHKRNKILLIIVVFLIKHVFDVAIERINLQL